MSALVFHRLTPVSYTHLAPGLLQIGGLTTATFSSAGANTAMGIFLVCVGSQIRVKQAPQVLKRGFVLLAAKFLAGASIGWAVGAFFGEAGILGLSSLALISAVTNSNGGLFMSLASQFGDDIDIGAQAILNINDGPFLTLVALGASGMAAVSYTHLDVYKRQVRACARTGLPGIACE